MAQILNICTHRYVFIALKLDIRLFFLKDNDNNDDDDGNLAEFVDNLINN